MHYHPFAQQLWFPFSLFALTGLLQIPFTVITTLLTNFFTQTPATGG